MMKRQVRCQSCGSEGVQPFYHVKDVPVHSCLLLTSENDALNFPRRDIELGFCTSCGFIGNTIFDPYMMRYAPGYEEQQSFSPHFNKFARDLATRLVERHDLRNKTVVEIGCGKGDFLALLCEIGGNRGVGIDPTYVPGRLAGPAAERVSFIRDFYTERYAYLRGDLVCCRHTLEHIPTPHEFLQVVERSVADQPQTWIFFEVPDVIRVLREKAFWDIYYEHCSYFSLGSLARLFRSCSFKVVDLASDYDGQYLLIEAQPSNGTGATQAPHRLEDDLAQLAKDVADFAANYPITIEAWRNRIRTAVETGRRVAIWGSGSKCVSFLSSLNLPDEISCVVVDINPYRQGKYLPASGKRIMPPDFLKEYGSDTVIAMNSIYCREIGQQLNSMGLSPEVLAV